MKPGSPLTVVFHSSSPSVWQAVIDAFRANHLDVERSSILDKVQASFKQTVSAGGTRDDALFLLRAAPDGSAPAPLPEQAVRAPVGESSRRQYTRYVSECVRSGKPVKLAAREFYELIEAGDAISAETLSGR
jgi:hypothetical protein